jgi:hypothetical protein
MEKTLENDGKLAGVTYAHDLDGVFGPVRIDFGGRNWIRQDIYDSAVGVLDRTENEREEAYDVVEVLQEQANDLAGRVSNQCISLEDFYRRFRQIALAVPDEARPVGLVSCGSIEQERPPVKARP